MPAKPSKHATLPEWLVVGFTGHRDIGDPALATAAIEHALDELAEQNPRLLGISSVASGGDTLFGEAMVRRGSPIRVILPFPEARFGRDFDSCPEGWARAQALIRAAVEVDTVQNKTSEPDADDRAYLEAGIRSVERADVMMTVWDGQPARGPGGTGDVIDYIDKIGRPLIIVHPATGEITRRRFDQISRNDDRTSQDAAREAPRAVLNSYFEALDVRAKSSAPVVRELIRWCVWLHLGVSSVAAATLVFDAGRTLALVASGLDILVLVVAVTLLAFHSRYHRAWRESRAEAEICRSALASWDIRRHEVAGREMQAPIREQSRLVRTLEVLRLLDRSPAVSLEAARATYGEKRIKDQIDYFKDKRADAHRQMKRRKALMMVFSTISIISSFGLAAILVRESEHPFVSDWLEFLGIVAPLAASAIGILLISDESARRDERYAEMIETLEELKPYVDAAQSWASLNRAVSLVEDRLLEEVLEWQSFVRHTEHLL